MISQLGPDALAACKTAKVLGILKCVLDYSKPAVFLNGQLKSFAKMDSVICKNCWIKNWSTLY